MAKVVPLCSSSKGNSTYIGDSNNGLLIDVGCSFKSLNSSLDLCGFSLQNVRAILITHEHIDHVKGLLQLTKHTNIPVFASTGTINYMISNNLVSSTANLYNISDLEKAPLEYEINAFHTPHDSSESVGYTIVLPNSYKISFCTDLGNVTEEVRKNTIDSDFIFLESNYEIGMLNANPRYPEYLKKRISSDNGHLSNSDSASYLSDLVKNKTRRIILGHLSEENNSPEIAYKNAVRSLLSCGMQLDCDYTLNIASVCCKGETVVL